MQVRSAIGASAIVIWLYRFKGDLPHNALALPDLHRPSRPVVFLAVLYLPNDSDGVVPSGSVVWQFRPVRVVVPSCVLHCEVVRGIGSSSYGPNHGGGGKRSHLAGYLARLFQSSLARRRRRRRTDQIAALAMFTPLECRLRAADCQRMMAHAPNPRMQAILLT